MCFIKPIPQYKVRPSTKKVISTITATTVALSILGKNVTHSIQWLADPMTCRWSTNKKTEKDNLKIHIEKTTKYDSKRPIRMKSKKKNTTTTIAPAGTPNAAKKTWEQNTGLRATKNMHSNGVPWHVDVFSNTGVQIWSTNFEFFRSKHACVKAEEVCSTPADTPALTQEATTYHTKILPA